MKRTNLVTFCRRTERLMNVFRLRCVSVLPSGCLSVAGIQLAKIHIYVLLGSPHLSMG